MPTPRVNIGNRIIGRGHPVYVVAELSANHNQNLDRAIQLVRAAKDAGADAVKVQTYTADTLTLASDAEPFRIKGTLWDGKTLHDLFREAYTPWEWMEPIQKASREAGLDFFSSPFDDTAVDFLEKLNPPCYKIASSELVDLALLRKTAETGKPVILSTGMATKEEIEEAVKTVRKAGNEKIVLLRCVASYPADPAEMNLRAIPLMEADFGVPVGFSDHSLVPEPAMAAVAVGACLVERHLTLSRKDDGPDAKFSTEPGEFKAMVDGIRAVEKALGEAAYGPTKSEAISRRYRRSLFASASISKGETLTAKNVRSVRPGHGLPPRDLEKVIGRKAKFDIKFGTPLSWDLID